MSDIIEQTVTTDSAHTMQCMEIWGGIGATQRSATMAGLDVWVFSKPHMGDAEGGDIHYVSSCGTGRISRVLIADVAGHGTKVAKLATTLRDMMRRYVNYIDQTSLVSRMNREFATESSMGRFATAVICTYYAPTNVLVACNAGHPRPFVFSSRTRKWRALDEADAARKAEDKDEGAGPSNLPLGVVDDSSYRQIPMKMSPGDLVIVYTDSLVEARLPSPAGKEEVTELLGEERLLEIVQSLDQSKPDTIAEQLYRRVIEVTGGAQPDDDVTILVMRVNGRQARLSLREKLTSQMRFVGMLIGSFRRGASPVPWPEFRAANLLGPFVPSMNRSFMRDAPVNE